MYNTKYSLELQDRIKELADRVTIIDNEPSYQIIDNGYILPRKFLNITNDEEPYQGRGGVVDAGFKFVVQSAVYDLINSNDQTQAFAFGLGYEFDETKCMNESQIAIYLGFANTHWGHFLIDVIQRTWIFLRPSILRQVCKENNNYVFVFAGDSDRKVEFGNNEKEFFSILGLNIENVQIISEPTKYDKIVVPDVVIYPGKYVYAVYKELINTVIVNAMHDLLKNKNMARYNKIYFSRAHLNNIQEIGERDIEHMMLKGGYKVLYPEELSLKEQIYYWQTADEIACVNGTIPHNCVFARKGVSLYIFCKMKKMVGYQFTLDKIWGEENEVTYISAYKELYKRYPLTVSRGPFWLTVNSNVVSFAKDKLGIEIKHRKKLTDLVNYHIACLYVELKYRLRGIRLKIHIRPNK